MWTEECGQRNGDRGMGTTVDQQPFAGLSLIVDVGKCSLGDGVTRWSVIGLSMVEASEQALGSKGLGVCISRNWSQGTAHAVGIAAECCCGVLCVWQAWDGAAHAYGVAVKHRCHVLSKLVAVSWCSAEESSGWCVGVDREPCGGLRLIVDVGKCSLGDGVTRWSAIGPSMVEVSQQALGSKGVGSLHMVELVSGDRARRRHCG